MADASGLPLHEASSNALLPGKRKKGEYYGRDEHSATVIKPRKRGKKKSKNAADNIIPQFASGHVNMSAPWYNAPKNAHKTPRGKTDVSPKPRNQVVSTAAAGSLQIAAPSITPSTSSIIQQVSSTNAGSPPPSKVSSSVVENTEKASPTAAALAVNNSCPPPSKASSISPAVPSTCPIVDITQKYSPAARAGGPPPSEASSSTFSTPCSTRERANSR